MEIKLTKTENILGEIWYYVYVDDLCVKAFIESKTDIDERPKFKEASNLYLDLVERAKNGYPKTTTIHSYNVENKDDEQSA